MVEQIQDETKDDEEIQNIYFNLMSTSTLGIMEMGNEWE